MSITRDQCTYTTVITWQQPEHQVNVDLETVRKPKLDTMANVQQVADNEPDVISTVETKRYWLDQTSAETYKDFIIAQCTALSIPLPAIVVNPK